MQQRETIKNTKENQNFFCSFLFAAHNCSGCFTPGSESLFFLQVSILVFHRLKMISVVGVPMLNLKHQKNRVLTYAIFYRFLLRFIYLVLVFINIFAFIFYLFSQYMGNSQKNCIFQVTVKYYQRMIKLLEFLFMELQRYMTSVLFNHRGQVPPPPCMLKIDLII